MSGPAEPFRQRIGIIAIAAVLMAAVVWVAGSGLRGESHQARITAAREPERPNLPAEAGVVRHDDNTPA